MDEQDEMPELPDVAHETLQTPEEDVTDQAQAEAETVADDQVMRTVGESLPVLTLPRIEREDAVAPEVGAAARVPEAAGPEGRREEKLIPESSASSEAAREAEGEPELVLERKHLLAVRWMHWVNFPVLFTMIWSGILIYWNDSDNSFKHAHQVYGWGSGSSPFFGFFRTGSTTIRFTRCRTSRRRV